MTLTVAIQMDPIEQIDIYTDSTFAIALEGQARGHKLYHYLPGALSLDSGRVTATGHSLVVHNKLGDHYSLGDEQELDLSAIDVVLMRQDPPFNMSYITATHLLEQIHPNTLVVNDPSAVRNSPEKLLVTKFPDLMPPTLITSDPQAVENFRAKHRDIVLKPLFGNGGAGVFHIAPDDENLTALLEMFSSTLQEPIVAQRYLPEVRSGDKRIILINGEAAGAINRVPPPGEARANMHVGAQAEPADITDREQSICASIGPSLKQNGLVFVGIDVIGGYLTEINVTSPTGIQEYERFTGISLSTRIWEAIEAKRP